MNTNKTNLLTKIGLKICTIGYRYKEGGIKAVYYFIKTDIAVSIYKYRFKHCKKFREKVLSNLTADNIFFVACIDFTDTMSLDLRKYIPYLSDVEKEKLKKNLSVTKKALLKYNLTEEQLNSAYKMFGIDLLDEQEEPKKVQKRKKTTSKSKKD